MPDVMGEVNRRHAAGPDLAVEVIAVRQGSLEPADELRHGGPFWLGMLEDASDWRLELGAKEVLSKRTAVVDFGRPHSTPG
jgi:hypothetical protein